MAEQIDFEEVESGNSGTPESARTVEETSEQEFSGTEEIHCYVVFSEDISLEDGIEAIFANVTDGEKISIERRDDAGNAVVVILTPVQYEQVKKLPEVTSVNVMEEAELTQDASAEEPMENASEKELPEEPTENASKEDTSEEMTENIFPEEESEEMTTESLVISEAEVGQSFMDTHVKELRIAVIVVVLLVLLIGYLQQKRRW